MGMCDHVVAYLLYSGAGSDTNFPVKASEAKSWATDERDVYFRWINSDPKIASLNKAESEKRQAWTLKDWLASESDLFDFCPKCGARIDWDSLLNE